MAITWSTTSETLPRGQGGLPAAAKPHDFDFAAMAEWASWLHDLGRYRVEANRLSSIGSGPPFSARRGLDKRMGLLEKGKWTLVENPGGHPLWPIDQTRMPSEPFPRKVPFQSAPSLREQGERPFYQFSRFEIESRCDR
jgi:hypothetical protein